MVTVYYIDGPRNGTNRSFAGISSDWRDKCPHVTETEETGTFVASKPVPSKWGAQGYIYTRAGGWLW